LTVSFKIAKACKSKPHMGPLKIRQCKDKRKKERKKEQEEVTTTNHSQVARR